MTLPAATRLTFIGGGNMTRSLLGGLLSHGADPSLIKVTAASETTRDALARELGVITSADNAAAVAGARIVVLSVKPQIMGAVARALAPALATARPLVISVAAGIRAGQLRQWIGPDVPLVRAMPNRPALQGAGATGLYADTEVNAADRRLAEDLLATTGLALWVRSEDELDLVMALSGCGPAYFFRLAELMAQAAAARGLDPEVARRLAAQTLAGAGQMVAAQFSAGATAPDLPAMCAAVASRGGSTAAALARFDTLGLPAVVAEAMAAAVTRSHEMAQQYGQATE